MRRRHGDGSLCHRGLITGKALDKGKGVMFSSRRANTASKEGARTQADDQLDDGILTQNIELAAKRVNIVYKVAVGRRPSKLRLLNLIRRKGLSP